MEADLKDAQAKESAASGTFAEMRAARNSAIDGAEKMEEQKEAEKAETDNLIAEANEDLVDCDPPEELTNLVKSWLEFEPGGNLASEFPDPVKLAISAEAKDRWNAHAKGIRKRMDSESEIRAAVWGRVAARSLKFALVHRAALVGEVEEITKVKLEISDLNWGIKLSNWLAQISCGIVCETMPDLGLSKAKEALLRALGESTQVSSRSVLRANRTLTAGDVSAAADKLGLQRVNVMSGGRPKLYYCR